MGLIDYVRSDLARLKEPTFKNFIRTYYSLKGGYFRFQVWLRIVQSLKKNLVTKYTIAPIAYLRLHHMEYKYGIHANTNIHIGEGLKIIHAGGVYLNCSYIGDNFTVYQGATFGTRHAKDDIPKVMNNVTVYPNAVICGNITLSDGVVVGANAYIDFDLPVGTKVVGQKARIIQ